KNQLNQELTQQKQTYGDLTLENKKQSKNIQELSQAKEDQGQHNRITELEAQEQTLRQENQQRKADYNQAQNEITNLNQQLTHSQQKETIAQQIISQLKNQNTEKNQRAGKKLYEEEVNMFKRCADCGQEKRIPQTETLCYSCRERRDKMLNCKICQQENLKEQLQLKEQLTQEFQTDFTNTENTLKETQKKLGKKDRELTQQKPRTDPSPNQPHQHPPIPPRLTARKPKLKAKNHHPRGRYYYLQINFTQCIERFKVQLATAQQKYQDHLTQEKAQLAKEIQLIKEEKNSKKGKCAFLRVSKKDNKFLVVDLLDNPVENDLGEIENIEIQFKSGEQKRIKPKNYQEPKDPKQKEIFLNKEEIVLFFNNPQHTPNLKEELSEFRRIHGIEHITSKKEDRMNNPEIETNQVQFVALERRKKRIREASIRDFENKKMCSGKHVLSYGSYQEHKEEMEQKEEVEKLNQGKERNNQKTEIKQENT
ncbi:2906_t:CDS:2, partial [Entrophospora sp. SA101]